MNDVNETRREYYVRGKKVTVEEIPGVLAVKLEATPEEPPGEVAKQFGRLATGRRRKDERAFTISDQEQEAFTGAGWVFVRPSAEVARAAEARAAPAGATYAGRVFRHPHGHILVGTDRLTVKLQPDMSETEVQSALKGANLEVIRQLKFAPHLYEVRVAADRDPLDVAVELHQDQSFVFAEPQMIQHIPQRFTPTDPNYDQQWQWNNDGSGGGTAGADIDAEPAWDFTRGSGVRVAVIDNGFDVTHPDLAPAIVGAVGYFQADGMGGANFVVGLAGYPDTPFDGVPGHGTFCAGMALARANNGICGCGAANQAGFIPVAALGDQIGTQATLARAVSYAADPTTEPAAVAAGLTAADGADVISCSLGPNGADWEMESVLQLAIDYAIANGRAGLGTPIFWAVTNGDFTLDGADGTDEVVSYPSVIAVGRSTRNDTHNNSGYGPELDFLAPGVDVYSTTSGGGCGTGTGTSYAAPCAAGVGALVLAVNPDLTWDQVRQVMRNTCDKVGGVAYGADGHHDRYGFGRVNAARAVCEAGWIVDLTTPSLTFSDVPEGETTVRAIVFSIRSCQAVNFQIISGPTVTSGPGSFDTPMGLTASLGPTTDFTTLREARLWISYTGTSDGDVATGTVTVRCVETEEEWTIPITADTIARPNAAVSLVLDKSGSMDWTSGFPVPLDTRIQVLRFSATPLVDIIPEDNAIGIVSFDQDADSDMPVTPVGPPTFGAGRTTARATIAAHTSTGGATSIGDGVVEAHNQLDPVIGYDLKATVVFTDGHENRAEYIADVSDLINERVYAIGLGTAEEIRPSALTALTNGTGGYLLLTGDIGDDLFRLAKYFLQVLAGVANEDIVLDPQGRLPPGQVHRIPFRLNETDITSDVILLTPLPQAIRFALETPNGDLIDPGVAAGIPTMLFAGGSNVVYYRMSLPVPVGTTEAGAGQWHALLTIDQKYHGHNLMALADPRRSHAYAIAATTTVTEYPELYQEMVVHGIPYSLNVHAYSNLRLRASLSQDSLAPGATLTLRAALTEYGLPVENRASVQAELVRPDDTTTSLPLTEVEPGVFEASTVTAMSGVYRFQVRATGATLRGRPFTREQTVTGAVWQGGDSPPPSSKDDPRERDERLCKLLACLLSEQIISPQVERELKERGINLEVLRKCLTVYCTGDQLRPVTKTTGNEFSELVSALQLETLALLRRLLRESGLETEY